MKKILALAFGLALVGTLCYGQASTVTSVNVVGFMKLQIAGHPASNLYSLLSAPMTKIPVARGVIDANTTTTITDNEGGWTVGQFATGVAGQETTGTSTFYVEVTEPASAFVGRHFYIANNDATTLTLANPPADLVVNDLQNAAYKIIAANRVRDLFGDPGSQKLQGGGSAAGADNVMIWTGSGWASSVYFKNSGFPTSLTNHWVQGSTVVDDMVVDRDAGFMLKRYNGPATNIVVSGEVSPNTQKVIVDPETIGYVLLGGMSAVTEPITNSTLRTVMRGAGSAAAADNISFWTGSGWSTAIYFKDSGFPTSLTNHWVQGSVIVDDFVLEAGKGYMFKIVPPFSTNIWTRTSPLE